MQLTNRFLRFLALINIGWLLAYQVPATARQWVSSSFPFIVSSYASLSSCVLQSSFPSPSAHHIKLLQRSLAFNWETLHGGERVVSQLRCVWGLDL